MEVDDVCILGCLSNDPVIPADSKQLHDFSGKADVFLCVSRVPVTPAPSPSHTESSALLAAVVVASCFPLENWEVSVSASGKKAGRGINQLPKCLQRKQIRLTTCPSSVKIRKGFRAVLRSWGFFNSFFHALFLSCHTCVTSWAAVLLTAWLGRAGGKCLALKFVVAGQSHQPLCCTYPGFSCPFLVQEQCRDPHDASTFPQCTSVLFPWSAGSLCEWCSPWIGNQRKCWELRWSTKRFNVIDVLAATLHIKVVCQGKLWYGSGESAEEPLKVKEEILVCS